MTDGARPAVRLDGVDKRFGAAHVLHSVGFEIGRGELVGFVGPNGAGKTTTLRIMTGFLAPDAGSVEIDGVDVAVARDEARRRIGYLPESTPLYPEMRVREYLGFRARLKGVGRKEVAARVDEMAERVSVADRLGQRIGTLSKGYRQRVGLADALIARPAVLLLDEPTSGLDPLQVVEVRDLFVELSAEHTVVLSTHALAEVEAICGRAIVIAGGRIVGDGAPAALRERAGLAAGASFEDVFVALAGGGGMEPA